jgi:hypothetical protein
MRIYRIGLPVLTGLVILFGAQQSIRLALDNSDTALLSAVYAWLLQVAVAIGLLLAALAISRRSRLGYFLGVGIAVVMGLGGLALIVSEVPYLAGGGLGGALGAALVVLASAWILAWAVHGISMRRARASFAPAWQPIDRRLGIVLGSLAVFTAAAYVSLGLVVSDRAAAAEMSLTEATALVDATSIEAHVIEVSYGPAPDDATASVVEKLTLQLTFIGAPDYRLARVPSVCLTEAAMAHNPAFKPGVYCWGGGGSAIALSDSFRDMAMPASPRTVQLSLERGASLCAFGAGEWTAEVRIAPLVAGADAGSEPEVYFRMASFVVASSEASPLSATEPGSSCIDSTVSP